MARTKTGPTKVSAGVWQLKKNLYRIRVRAPSPKDGKIKQRHKRFHGTQAEAVAERERWREEITLGVEAAPPTTLASFAISWIETKKQKDEVTRSTLRRYADALAMHILPALGDLYLDRITTSDVEAVVTQWCGRFKPSTTNSLLRVLRACLSAAVTAGLVQHNVAAQVRAVREGTGNRDVDQDEYEPNDDEGHEIPDAIVNAIAPADVCTYLQTWQEMFPDDYALVLTLVLTGVRWSEATALRWSDVLAAEQHGGLHIRRSQVRGRVRDTTKNGHARVVPFPPELQQALRAHRTRMATTKRPGREAWVFPNEAGRLRANGNLSDRSRKVLAQAGLPHCTIHGLRRTHTDLLRVSGVDRVVRQKVVGHLADSMVSHYSTVRASEAKAAGARVSALLFNAPAEDGGTTSGTTPQGERKQPAAP